MLNWMSLFRPSQPNQQSNVERLDIAIDNAIRQARLHNLTRDETLELLKEAIRADF